MSSIRPLITITIMVAVGVFLFMKINEGPVPLPAEADACARAVAGRGHPAVVDGDDDSAARPGAIRRAARVNRAPQWADGATESVASTPPTAPPMNLSTENPPASAARIRAWPRAPVPSAADSGVAAARTVRRTTNAAPIPLPANIPVAQYPGDAATANHAAGDDADRGRSRRRRRIANAATPTPPTAEAVSPAAPIAPPASRRRIVMRRRRRRRCRRRRCRQTAADRAIARRRRRLRPPGRRFRERSSGKSSSRPTRCCRAGMATRVSRRPKRSRSNCC